MKKLILKIRQSWKALTPDWKMKIIIEVFSSTCVVLGLFCASFIHQIDPVLFCTYLFNSFEWPRPQLFGIIAGNLILSLFIIVPAAIYYNLIHKLVGVSKRNVWIKRNRWAWINLILIGLFGICLIWFSYETQNAEEFTDASFVGGRVLLYAVAFVIATLLYSRSLRSKNIFFLK